MNTIGGRISATACLEFHPTIIVTLLVTTLNEMPQSKTLMAILSDVQRNQKPARQIHIYGVIQSALVLAQVHDVDPAKAAMAAALHDAAKHVGREQTLQLHKENKINLSEIDLQYPALWHGAVAAWAGKTYYNISDPEILDAVEHHTLGHSHPSPLLQVLMCADSTEPSRDFPGVEELRKSVRNDLRTGLLTVLKAKVSEIQDRGQTPHPRIFETLESLEK